jgi:hypothetical protein
MSDPDTGDFEGLPPAEATDPDEIGVEEPPDPPDRWVGATKYGTTPFEESVGEPIDLQLKAERPDVIQRDPNRGVPRELREQFDGSVHQIVDDDEL